MDGRELLGAALDAARGAAAVHREHLGRVRVEDWSEKGVADFVSHVDRAAEAGIISLVRDRFPDHRLLAEEDAAEHGSDMPFDTGCTWIIDPLDGTTNYLHGYPMYAVSIGVVAGRDLVAAVVLNSATGDEWTAARGGGAFLNGTRVQVSAIERLPRALIGTGFWPSKRAA